MGSPKALLPIEGKSFIERIISVFGASRAGKILVVLGHNAKEIEARIRHLPVTVVVNRDYAQGQLSSLNAAIRTLKAEEVDGIVVHLVDHPFLTSALVDEMIDRFYGSGKPIVVPCYRGQRGHPVLLSSRLFSELMSLPLDRGAKAVVHAHRDETLEIETEDQGVIIDIDTPEKYRQHVGGK